MDKTYSFSYQELAGPNGLEPRERSLVEQAIAARDGAWAPYSGFQVGAALLLADGTVVTGSNQENVAYPAGLCAERTAMFAASANHPGIPFEAMAIAGGKGTSLTGSPITPCGECRQVMSEYRQRFGQPIVLLLVGQEKIIRIADCADLLPLAFDF